MRPLHVLLIDDHPVVRFGMRALVQNQYPWASIDEAATVAQTQASLAARSPHIALLDIHLAHSNGLDLIQTLLQYQSKVLVLSLRDEWSVVQAALNAGASGYVVKDAAGSELCQAMDTILQGRTYIAPRWKDRIVTGAVV